MIMKKIEIKNKYIKRIIRVFSLLIIVGSVLVLSKQGSTYTNEIITFNSNPSKNNDVKVMAKVVDGFVKEEIESQEAEAAKQAEVAKQAAAETVVVQAPPAAPASEIQAYAYDLVIARGWTDEDFNSLVALWNKESGWRPNASNGSCYGIPQACPGSKMGANYTDWHVQVEWGLNYIASRYGSPSNAWAHSQSTGWY